MLTVLKQISSGKLRLFLFLLLFLHSTSGPNLHAQDTPPSTDFVQGTLQQMLEQTILAFGNKDYASAIILYETLESKFGKEVEYQADTVQRTILPAWAYAHYMVADYEQAIERFGFFLERYPEPTPNHDFIIYTLAEAYKKAGKIEKAIDTYERFKQEFPDKDETDLIWMNQARLLFDDGQSDRGFALLEKFFQSNAAFKLRMQGRLYGLQQAEKLNDLARAEDYLLNTNWSVGFMPELAILTFTAIKVGDKLMNEKRYEEALRAYRLVPPKETLLLLQERKLKEVQYEADVKIKAYENTTNATYWSQHYSNLVRSVKAQLDTLNNTDDYTPPFLLRYGQAYLLLKRPREAWLAFEDVALDENLENNIREQAHFRWILAARSLEAWDDALKIARGFVERYPESENATRALFMMAESYQELHKYPKAIDVLTDLMQRYPDDALFDRWMFMRGYNYTLMSENIRAREDFSVYIQRRPDGILITQARLWHALTHFFDQEYEEALSRFDRLLGLQTNLSTVTESPEAVGKKPEGGPFGMIGTKKTNTSKQSPRKPLIPDKHPLQPEAEYRRASTLYAMRNYTAANDAIDAFLNKYPGHMRAPEARVLKGDILMGSGELDRAIETFKAVGPEAQGLFPYAVFQVGKIHKARSGAWEDDHAEAAAAELDSMIEHFQHYVDRTDIPDKIRISEALYWIGWAYTQKGEIEKAFPVFTNALDKYGDNRDAGEVIPILQGLSSLHRKSRLTLSESIRDNPILITEKFSDWVNEERQRALARKQYTYYSRLSLYLSDVYAKREPTTSELMLIEAKENCPLEKLDAEGMGRIGVMVMDVLESIDGGQRYFEALLEEFPASLSRAYALYGMGKIELERYQSKIREGKETAAEDALVSARTFLTRFSNETPVHPLMPDATILFAETLSAAGEVERAQDMYENLLRIKQARGKPHARALLGLSQLMQDNGENEKAIAYAQRVYTVYRAYPELLAPAYYNSAQLFEQLGDPGSAFRTYREMLLDKRLESSVLFKKAKEEFARLDSELPDHIKNPPQEEDSPEEDATERDAA